MSSVGIFPSVVTQAKKQAFVGISEFQMAKKIHVVQTFKMRDTKTHEGKRPLRVMWPKKVIIVVRQNLLVSKADKLISCVILPIVQASRFPAKSYSNGDCDNSKKPPLYRCLL